MVTPAPLRRVGVGHGPPNICTWLQFCRVSNRYMELHLIFERRTDRRLILTFTSWPFNSGTIGDPGCYEPRLLR